MPDNKAFSRIDLLGLPLDAGVEQAHILSLLDKKDSALVSFINPAAWALARRNPDFRRALEQMDFVLPDGIGVCLACQTLKKIECERISFDISSLANPFFKKHGERDLSLFLVGGSDDVALNMKKKLSLKYKDLNIVGTESGFGDWNIKIANILAVNPHTVLVGMGAPKQEEFILALRARGYNGLAISCGGFFDQYLLADNYYPALVNKLHVRFAYRLYKEPQRLWRRYLLDYPTFVWLYLQAMGTKLFSGKCLAK